MAIRITGIKPKVTKDSTDSVNSHLAIKQFQWINESSLTEGTSSRASMFNWVVNKKGRAYIKIDDKAVLVFGAENSSGKKYIRTIEEGKWTDSLLDLPKFEE